MGRNSGKNYSHPGHLTSSQIEVTCVCDKICHDSQTV